MPCRLFVAQYLYNIHMRWLQYLRVRNSKYIRFKGLDNSRLHVAGRDSHPNYARLHSFKTIGLEEFV